MGYRSEDHRNRCPGEHGKALGCLSTSIRSLWTERSLQVSLSSIQSINPSVNKSLFRLSSFFFLLRLHSHRPSLISLLFRCSVVISSVLLSEQSNVVDSLPCHGPHLAHARNPAFESQLVLLSLCFRLRLFVCPLCRAFFSPFSYGCMLVFFSLFIFYSSQHHLEQMEGSSTPEEADEEADEEEEEEEDGGDVRTTPKRSTRSQRRTQQKKKQRRRRKRASEEEEEDEEEMSQMSMSEDNETLSDLEQLDESEEEGEEEDEDSILANAKQKSGKMKAKTEIRKSSRVRRRLREATKKFRPETIDPLQRIVAAAGEVQKARKKLQQDGEGEEDEEEEEEAKKASRPSRRRRAEASPVSGRRRRSQRRAAQEAQALAIAQRMQETQRFNDSSSDASDVEELDGRGRIQKKKGKKQGTREPVKREEDSEVGSEEEEDGERTPRRKVSRVLLFFFSSFIVSLMSFHSQCLLVLFHSMHSMSLIVRPGMNDTDTKIRTDNS